MNKKLDSFLHIGVEKEAIEAAKIAILEILSARADQETIRVALGVFVDTLKIDNVEISNCTFSGEGVK